MNSRYMWTEMKGLVSPHIKTNKSLRGLAGIRKEIVSLHVHSKLDLWVIRIVLIGDIFLI